MTEEISREALLIYLNDLRTMETIIHESDNAIENIQKKQGDCKTDVLEHEKSKPQKPIEPKRPTDADKRNERLKIIFFALLFFFFAFGAFRHFAFRLLEGGFFVFLCALIFALTGVTFFLSAMSSEKNKENKRYEEEKEYLNKLHKYERNITEYNQTLREKIDFRDEILKKARTSIDEINAEKNDISEKLQEAYNANIIPLTFRNIQGIYYLYDYLSTSNQSLSEALMQCNLEAIKAKLDNVIELQGKAIVQQAQANQVLFEQNQHILETAQATMNNTAVAAKYAQISAVNSAISLKLQQKNLAYQRADFWLK